MHIDTLINQLTHNKSPTIPLWLKRVRPDILSWLEQETKQYKVKNTMERVYIMLHGEPPKCLDGNYCNFNTFEKGYRTGCSLGNKCASVAQDRLTNQKATMLEKYGTENAAQLEFVQLKIKKTNRKRYGTEHHSQNAAVKQKTIETKKNKNKDQLLKEKEKSKLTNIQKYGVDHHMKLQTQQDKVRDTNLSKRGVEYPLQDATSLSKMKETSKSLDRSSIKKKTKDTIFDRYGVTAASRINLPKETLRILDDRDIFRKFVNDKERKDVLQQLQIAEHTLYLYAKKYDAASLFKRPLVSAFEIEVADFLTQNGIRYEQNNRTIISPKELDFFLPDYDIAIECCGIYWHSELSAGRTSQYHYEKFKQCKEKNIQLITIFDDEWNDKREIVMSMLRNKLLTNSKLFARNCKIVSLTKSEAEVFINKHHVQGYTSGSVRIGLQHQGSTVAVMTFGKSRFNKKYEWELLRFCSNAVVVGGAGKLLSYFVGNFKPKNIVSYSDNRWFTGTVYDKLGFTEKSTTVGYFYTDYNKRYNRLAFQKYKLVSEGFNAMLSEWEIMQQRKFDRIWDCGQVCWELEIKR
jgi:G:T-mismatch repair DNA endonuclease (very short patch repair protein)